MKSSRIAVLLSVVAVIALVTVAALSGLPLRVAAQQEFSASLTPVAGLVQYQARGSTRWVTLTDTQIIRAGDQLRTGNNGLARLTVVTGIEVTIYPTSLVQLDSLAMAQDAGQTFLLTQLVGQTFVSINRALRPTDKVQVTLPTSGVTVKGTQFWLFVHPDLRGAIFSQDNKVSVRSGNGQTTEVTPENFTFIDVKLPNPVPLICSPAFLQDNVAATLVSVPVQGDKAKESAVHQFLRDFITANVNPLMRTFLRGYLGLKSVSLTSLAPDQDKAELDELLKAVADLDTTKLNLTDLLTKYREYWGNTYKGSLNSALAAATCGNGRQDSGETASNCPTDVSNDTTKAACGNGLCETNRTGLAESVINCTADCLSHESLARSCAALILAPVLPQVPPPQGTPVPGNATPTPILPSNTQTPTPSL